MITRSRITGSVQVETRMYYSFFSLHPHALKMGFREGLFKGKSKSVQKGFDAGYALHLRLAVLSSLASEYLKTRGDQDLVRSSRLALAMHQLKNDQTIYEAIVSQRMCIFLDSVTTEIQRVSIDPACVFDVSQFPADSNGNTEPSVTATFCQCLIDILIFDNRPKNSP